MSRIKFVHESSSMLQTQFWFRALAFWIDFWIFNNIILPFILFVIPSLRSERPSDLSDEIAFGIMMNEVNIKLLMLALLFIYNSALESSPLQATIGKWFMKIKVYDKEYKRISFLKALVRNVLKIISTISVVGVFLIDMTPRRQALHDLLSGTIVLRR
ncbi:MAG: RDD family protein [Cyclobacteriaceae bacterium]|nr:MAG: RDD family protein [Cyclobacteriaceae bacterium]